MQILVAMRKALQSEGIAHVLRSVSPGARIVPCDKRDLLSLADPAVGRLGAAVIAHPWISLTTLKALHRRQPAAAVVVYSGQADAALHQTLLAVNVAAMVAHDASPEVVGAAVRVALFGHVSVKARCLRTRDRSRRGTSSFAAHHRAGPDAAPVRCAALARARSLQQADRGRPGDRPSHGEGTRRCHLRALHAVACSMTAACLARTSIG